MRSFLSLAIIIFITGVVLKIHMLYNLAYFFFGLHILISLYHRNLVENLKITHQLKDDHIFLNEKIECQIKFVNQGRLPVLWLKFIESLPVKLTAGNEKDVIKLNPGEVKNWSFELKGRRRGLYHIGPVRWECGDIIGYNSFNGELQEIPVIVFPRILSIEELGLPSRLPFGGIKWPQPLYKDPYQMVGIRDYQSGDRLNKIHWKATARTGSLLVRENQSTVSLETAIFLNLSQLDYGLKYLERKTELAITTAASIAYYLTRAGQPVSLITNGINPFADYSEKIVHPSGRGEMHLQQLLETLACIEITKKDDFITLLSGKLDLSWGATIIIITNQDTEELIKICYNLIARGFSVKLIIVGHRVLHRQYLHRPFTAPLSIYQVRREEDIYGIS